MEREKVAWNEIPQAKGKKVRLGKIPYGTTHCVSKHS